MKTGLRNERQVLFLAAATALFGMTAEVPGASAVTNAATVYREAFARLEGTGSREWGWFEDLEMQATPAGQDFLRRVDESVALLHRAAEVPFCE